MYLAAKGPGVLALHPLPRTASITRDKITLSYQGHCNFPSQQTVSLHYRQRLPGQVTH